MADEELISTKERPSPFDGFESAKPGEPIFTLQGGDALAAPLVREWARLARERALGGGMDEAKAKALLIKATGAEAISWAMDEYRSGHVEIPGTHARYNEEQPDIAAKHALDRSAARVRMGRMLDNFVAELTDAVALLRKWGEEAEEPQAAHFFDAANIAEDGIDPMREASEMVRPARPAHITPAKGGSNG